MFRDPITLEDLYALYQLQGPTDVFLDVRSPAEFRQGHIPGSRNLPVEQITRNPQKWAEVLRHYGKIYLYCSAGERAKQAYEALAQAGLTKLTYMQDAGMPAWEEHQYPVAWDHVPAAGNPQADRPRPLRPRDLLVGMAAGLIANIVVGQVDGVLDQCVSAEQKRREKRLREASPHQIAGRRLAPQITGRRLSVQEQHQAQMVFTTAYGIVWGVVYAVMRKKVPQVSRWLGLPFGIGFFVACDGLLAPLLRLTPALLWIPWQLSVKELGNHIAWIATAELVHRGVEREE